MKQTKIFLTLCSSILLVSGWAHAQTIRVSPGDIKIEGIEFEAQKTPNFSAGGVSDKKVPNPREWLEVEVEFEADVRPKDSILPELLFRFYIGMVDHTTNQPVVLSGDVTHVNVITGEEYYSAVYVSPSTHGKLTGDFRRLDMGAVKAVGVEVFYNGVLVGLSSTTGSGTSGKFWEGKSISPGILSREETPFGILWIDRYPDVRAE